MRRAEHKTLWGRWQRNRKTKRFLGQRLIVFRLNEIAKMMLRSEKVNARTIAEKLEVSDRTVWRDIEFLRDFLRHDIYYEASTHSYRYRTRPLSLMDPNMRGPI